jgi:uncharacterized protein with PQ loop repeat
MHSHLGSHHHYHRTKGKGHEKRGGAGQVLDKLVYVIGALGPLFALHQVIKIWSEKSAQGVSLLAFGGNCLFAFIWVIYGAVHKERPIIFMNILWVIINGLVAIGVLLYG